MTLSKYILLGWFFLLGLIGAYLMYESYSYRQHIEQLSIVKQDYSNYVLALKKLIFEFESAKDSLETRSEDQKKKTV